MATSVRFRYASPPAPHALPPPPSPSGTWSVPAVAAQTSSRPRRRVAPPSNSCPAGRPTRA
eukprot:6864815-Prymnesium_polylepis.1